MIEILSIICTVALGIAFIIFSVKQITWLVKKIIAWYKAKKNGDSTKPKE